MSIHDPSKYFQMVIPAVYQIHLKNEYLTIIL